MKKIKLLILLSSASYINAQQISSDSFAIMVMNSDSILLSGSEVLYANEVKKTDNNGMVKFKFKNDEFVFVSFVGYTKLKIVNIKAGQLLKIILKEDIFYQGQYAVRAIRAADKSPFAFSNITANEISIQNLGQDFTYLLGNTPSVITTSDAGNGIGYSGVRVRGSDATRINVTINGIPINDAESHGVYWVNMPDLASSTSSVQIQRGVGSSTNGNGAFGASISIVNTELDSIQNFSLSQSYGSFNTLKSTLKFGTGKLGNFNLGGRLSRIVSDGYLDRANTALHAFQFNLNYVKNNWIVNALSFAGKEKTYQSWYGTPISRYNSNALEMNAYINRNYLSTDDANNLLNSNRTYNYYTYKNQIDNYWQNHYQLHLSKKIKQNFIFQNASFLTRGKGYFEEYKRDQKFSSYGVNNFINNSDTVKSTDLVRQRWLDNYYYGNFVTLSYKKNKLNASASLGFTKYAGKHFGEIIWANIASPFGLNNIYYNSQSLKQEWNGNIKLDYKITRKWTKYIEFQFRKIQYEGVGNDNELRGINFNKHFLFINPKVGVNYQLSQKKSFYASLSISNREPVRTDIVDNLADKIPNSEKLNDLEIGYILSAKNSFFQMNGYLMNYKNQMVLTGELNDVGSSIRANVDKSNRLGLEIIGRKNLLKNKLEMEGNFTISRNVIREYIDVVYNYDNSQSFNKILRNTPISFSPNVIGFIGITDKHFKDWLFNMNCKYVGKQYLDNTQNSKAMLDKYYTLNVLVGKNFLFKDKSLVKFKLMANNLLNRKYANNGYSYKYISGGETIIETYLYPQSLINFMFGVEFIF
ncbi:MAG: TonB-dependent receptor plug domain-containing protein [Bacteroidetes bacterium]|nr:TonB-dependent receptor plug domain-containing protein [Bacteroidota bacterium]